MDPIQRQIDEWRAKGLIIDEGKRPTIPVEAIKAATLPPGNFAKPPSGISEKVFQSFFIEFAQAHGWKVAHFRPAWVKTKEGEKPRMITAVAGDGKGFPDNLLARGERLFVAELKVQPNTPSEEQLAWLDAFRAAGIPAFVWYPEDWEVIENYLKKGS